MIFGKIYSNMCGHCNNMLIPWNDLKLKLKKNHPGKVNIKEIENSQNEAAQIEQINLHYVIGPTKLEQKGYPTIFKIVNGVVSYYEDERTCDKMYNWVSSSLKTSKNINKIKSMKHQKGKRFRSMKHQKGKRFRSMKNYSRKRV